MAIQVYVCIEPSTSAALTAIKDHEEWLKDDSGERHELILRRNDGKGALRVRLLTDTTLSIFPGSIKTGGDFQNEDWQHGDTTSITRGGVLSLFRQNEWRRAIRILMGRAVTHQHRWP